MPHLFPSAEWATAYQKALNENPAYKEAGKDWTHGVVAMIVKAEPSIGIAEDIGMWLDVHQGQCREARLVSAAEAQSAPFVIVAPYAQWKAVLKGEVDPTKAMMQNKLKLTKGHMPTIVKYVASSRELVRTTSLVSTKFKDEA